MLIRKFYQGHSFTGAHECSPNPSTLPNLTMGRGQQSYPRRTLLWSASGLPSYLQFKTVRETFASYGSSQNYSEKFVTSEKSRFPINIIPRLNTGLNNRIYLFVMLVNYIFNFSLCVRHVSIFFHLLKDLSFLPHPTLKEHAGGSLPTNSDQWEFLEFFPVPNFHIRIGRLLLYAGGTLEE